MKKVFLFIILFVVLNSCKTINLYNNVPIGKFNIKDDLYYEELELKKDGSFDLIINEGHTRDNCKGNWKVKSRYKLILNGFDTRKFFGIDSIYFKRLDCKNLLIQFKRRNKIKRKTYYLKRSN